MITMIIPIVISILIQVLSGAFHIFNANSDAILRQAGSPKIRDVEIMTYYYYCDTCVGQDRTHIFLSDTVGNSMLTNIERLIYDSNGYCVESRNMFYDIILSTTSTRIQYYQYDSLGNLIKRTSFHPDIQGDDSTVTDYYYETNRLVAEHISSSQNNYIMFLTMYSYDNNGDLVQSIVWDSSIPDIYSIKFKERLVYEYEKYDNIQIRKQYTRGDKTPSHIDTTWLYRPLGDGYFEREGKSCKEYDSRGFLIKEYKDNSERTDYYRYKLNEYGDPSECIKTYKTKYSEGEIISRKIIYIYEYQ